MEYFTVLTNIGAHKIAAATAANSTINLSEIAVGDGKGIVPVPNISQEVLVNEKFRAPLSELTQEVNKNHFIARSLVPADKGNFWIREIGIYDVDGDLIAVGNYPETYKSILADGAAKEIDLIVVFEVANADVVKLEIDPSIVMASQEFVNKKLLKKSDIGHTHDIYLKSETGTSKLSSPNDFLEGTALFLHEDCPNDFWYWYIIAINYTKSENGASMQIAVSYISNEAQMYIRTKKYSKTEWEAWQRCDNNGIIPKKIKRLSYTGNQIDGQFGFSSVVRIKTGWYDCYFSSPMPNTKYSVVSSLLGSDFVVGYSKYSDRVRINRIHSSDNIYYDGGFSIAILEDV